VTTALGGSAEVVLDTTGTCLAPAIGALTVGGRVAVIAAPPSGRVEVPVLDLYRRGGSIIGVNSLMRDSVATAWALDMLRIAFDTGSLPRPGAVMERPLAEAAEIYGRSRRAPAESSSSPRQNSSPIQHCDSEPRSDKRAR
jgi:NADPH:quinone reductase-like Zn-dependent oxidoreductase